MANQIPVVAILMIVQGVLECLLALLLVVAGVLLPQALEIAGRARQRPGGGWLPDLPPEFIEIAAVLYVGLGAVVLLSGLLRVIAGSRNLNYRGRTFGIVSLAAGVVTSLTIWCAPTSLGLLIYGLIVYLNEESARAFALGAEGKRPEEIKQLLAEGRRLPTVGDRGPGPSEEPP